MLAALPGVGAVTLLDTDAGRRRFALTVADARSAAPAVARAVGAQGWDLFGLEPERRDLEALFRAISGAPGPSATPSASPSAAQPSQEAVHV
jgi:ABC-2 type transport system ATP-binding protein